jgi:GTPase SAR1 family protein
MFNYLSRLFFGTSSESKQSFEPERQSFPILPQVNVQVDPTQSSSKCYKIICIGDKEVGKTTFINSMNLNTTLSYTETLYTNFKRVYLSDDKVSFQIDFWDMPGNWKKYLEEDGDTHTTQYFKMSYLNKIDVILLMFDLSSLSSFKSLSTWLSLLESNNNIRYVLGNKKYTLPTVPLNEIHSFIQEYNVYQYYNFSFMSQYDVHDFLKKLFQHLKLFKI